MKKSFEKETAIDQYLESILQCIEEHSMMRDNKELIKSIREELKADTRDARSIADTYPAIHKALQKLGDKHSCLVEPEAWKNLSKSNVILSEELPTGLVKGGIARIIVPEFAGQTPEIITAYVHHCHALIKQLDEQTPKGWVLDLRNNCGGNCWPMLAGLGPLLEEKSAHKEGLMGYFRPQDGTPETSWGYLDGAAWSETAGKRIVNANAEKNRTYHLKNPGAPLAVLIGEHTASSAEILTVACKNLPHAKIFGAKSAGLASVNTGMELPDKALLIIAIGTYADRTGKDYDTVISPDVKADVNEQISQAAAQWLTKQSDLSLQTIKRNTGKPSHGKAISFN